MAEQLTKDLLSERCQDILRRWERGDSAEKIGAALGVTTSAVYTQLRRARKAGEDVRKYRVKPDLEARRERIVALWNARVPTCEIAELLHVSRQLVLADVQVMRKRGRSLLPGAGRVPVELQPERASHFRPRPPSPHVARRLSAVEAMWNDYKTIKEIASEVGVPPKRIEKDLVKLRQASRIQRHRRGPKPSPAVIARRIKVAEMWNQDIPAGDIARHLEMSEKLVCADAAHLRTLGYELKRRGGQKRELSPA